MNWTLTLEWVLITRWACLSVSIDVIAYKILNIYAHIYDYIHLRNVSLIYLLLLYAVRERSRAVAKALSGP